jgi:menaquinone-dependent protoporphyrinogen oxidase
MESKVLVAYATKHGATAEIAEKIGEVLRQRGLEADVLPVQEVKDLAPYPAVILGSAVYVGQWRKEAVEFLEANEGSLAERDTWLFSSGPTGEGDPVELLQGWHFPEKQQANVGRIKPREVIVFHGNLDENTLNFFEKGLIKMVKAPTGDYRDWDEIISWANEVAETLKQPVI